MSASEKIPLNRPDRRQRSVIILLAVVLAGLVIWGMAANYLVLLVHIGGGVGLLLLTVLFATAWRKGLRWFVTRRALGFHLWVVATLFSIIVLFYAEEKWRGNRAWAALQAEAAARGESLELSSVIPPPVPDDQNFAKAPGVAAVIRFEPVAGDAKPARESSAFYHGKAEDWPEGKQLFQQFTDFEKWNAFLSAFSATNTTGDHRPEITTPSANAAEAVLEHLSRFDAAFATLRTAGKRPLARYPIDYTGGWAALGDSIHLITTDLRYSAHALRLRASAFVALGNADAALDDVFLSLRLADTLREEPFITAQRCRSDMLLDALQPVWEGLAKHLWNDEQLQRVQERFSAMDERTPALRGARGETILTMDMASQLEAYLAGRESRLSKHLARQEGADAYYVWLFRAFYPSGWLAQDRVWVYRFYHKHAVNNWISGSAQLDQKNWESELLQIMDPMLVIMVVPRVKQICEDSIERGLYLEAVCRQAATACALERYRLASAGRYPESLQQLVPSQLSQVPLDSLAGSAKVMTYRLVAPDRFTLYSVGLNKVDDGGKPMPVEHRFYPQFDHGDWVWSYPAM